MKRVASVLVLLLCVSALGGCQSTADFNRGVDNMVMRVFVGRDYADLVRQMDVIRLGAQQPLIGNRIGGSRLPNGMRLERHLVRSQGHAQGFHLGGLIGAEQRRMTYRLLYFKVDPAGKVVDTANGFLAGETFDCVSFLGGLIRRCDDPNALAADLQFFDSLVKTSDGQPLSEWFAPSRAAGAEPARRIGPA
ncbi:hypothetical protein [Salinarimonas sp.]|uniref:hypothetical protein n=1 Tax=Salinarimonas sp. TaxID=2766526 RepID=UPI00391B14AF